MMPIYDGVFAAFERLRMLRSTGQVAVDCGNHCGNPDIAPDHILSRVSDLWISRWKASCTPTLSSRMIFIS